MYIPQNGDIPYDSKKKRKKEKVWKKTTKSNYHKHAKYNT